MSEERKAFLVEGAREAFRQKLAENTKKGEDALLLGKMKPFQGYDPEAYKRDFTFVLELTPDSEQEVKDRVVEPLRALAVKHTIGSIFAGHGDLPPHVALQVARFQNLTPDRREELLEFLRANSYLKMVSDHVNGSEIPLGTLVVGRDIIVCAGYFDPETDMKRIFEGRKFLRRSYSHIAKEKHFVPEPAESESGLALIDYSGIIHITAARITQAPTEQTREQFVAFAEEAMATIQPSLQQLPIRARVQGAFQGLSYEYMLLHGGPFAA